MSDNTTPAEKSKLKESVLTPKTDFPMRADLSRREAETLKRWEEIDLYRRIRDLRRGSPKFILHDGPPYANGDAHTGTGMNKILKDMVVKFRTMQGFDSPYIPGWDCHGLPIEQKVLEDLGGTKPESMSVLEFRRRCLEFADKYVEIMRGQFKRTFTLGRWEAPYLTTSPKYEGGVLDCFADLMREGFIARAKKPVHWSWAARSALAEAELEYQNRQDPSIYVTFNLAAGTNATGKKLIDAAQEMQAALVIWTTTPWTLAANVAVAVAPNAEYTLYKVQKTEDSAPQAWLLATDLAPKVFEQSKVAHANPLLTLRGRELEGVSYHQPLWDTICPVVLADYVTLEDGTGLVHTAPGHGAEDFATGQKYQLPTICPVDDGGCYFKGDALTASLGLPKDFSDKRGWLAALAGQNVFAANKLVISRLEAEGRMVHWHMFEHSYPHCWRTHKPVIFRATEQWFVRMDTPADKPLRRRLLDEVERVKWFPAWGKKRISGMLESRPDWCISRQRLWGIPIPAFYDPHTGEVCADYNVAKRIADVVREHGSDVWYDDRHWPVDKLLPDASRPAAFKGRTLAKMQDIFDVWFESAASHRGVVAAEPELQDDPAKFRPADLYLEGDDQHRGWFQVSLIVATATKGCSPFQQCVTNAFVVDEKGEKGSKSKGNLFTIDWGCDQVGADLIRLYFASVDTSVPIPVTLKLISEKTANNYRTLRNTIRVLLGNLFDFRASQHLCDPAQMQELDRWVLSRLNATIRGVREAFERYEFHVATRRLVDFCNVDLSAYYIDIVKDRVYCDAPDGPSRRSAQSAMYHVASAIIRMLAPICPHTADEAWQEFARLHATESLPPSVHLADYPKAEAFSHDLALEARYSGIFKVKAAVDRILDRMRKDGSLRNSTAAHVTLATGNDELRELLHGFTPRALASNFVVSEVELMDQPPEGSEDAADVAGLAVRVLLSPHGKCERCWNHWPSVRHRDQHAAAVCDRCNEVLTAD